MSKILCLGRLLILSVVVVCCGSISVSINGLYCKDPDDNTFHPVNTTWQAKSFCGNYTCKVREKPTPHFKEENLVTVNLTAVNKGRNVVDTNFNSKDLGIDGADNSILVELVTQDILTTTETNPNINADVPTTVKQENNDNVFNIDKIIDDNNGVQVLPENTDKKINDHLKESNKTEVIIDWNDNFNIENDTKITKNFFNENSQQKEEILRKVEDKIYNTTPDDGDRLLTQEEIDTITKLLHTVKKSDLEALIEVYTLTKDIFKELQSREKDMLKEQKKKVKNQYQFPTAPANSISYFYEPIIDQSLKSDLHSADSNTVFSTMPSPSIYIKPESSPNPYAIPYFYRISDFQKLPHGYKHKHVPELSQTNLVKHESSPCNITVHMASKDMLNSKTQSFNVNTENTKSRHHYTYFDYPSYLYSGQISYPNYLYFHPWSFPLKITNDIPQDKPEILDDTPKVIESTGKIIERRNDDRSVVVPKFRSKNEKLPSWQTESLSQQVLEEVKSNIHVPDNLLLNKLRGTPKLERVGKLINLDSVLRRRKRNFEQTSAEELKVVVLPESQYEVYVEKVECGQSTEPGYFSHGNESLPYPKCCPTKIDNPKV